MYFKYIWNNFLHIQVEICTAMILAMPPAPVESPPEGGDQGHVRESALIKHVSLMHPNRSSGLVSEVKSSECNVVLTAVITNIGNDFFQSLERLRLRTQGSLKGIFSTLSVAARQ